MSASGKNPMIRDLGPGQEVTLLAVVSRKNRRAFRDPDKGHYLDLGFSDRSGAITGRAWENADALAERFSVGDVVGVRGFVEEYRGRPQLIVRDIQAVSEDRVDPDRFIPSSPYPLETMEATLWQTIETVEDPALSELLCGRFGEPEFYQAYIWAPAAKQVHHNYLNGLLEHSLEVVRLLLSYQKPMLQPLNRDLLIAGGLLHDVGKIDEYEYRTHIDYTPAGRLLGHIALGYGRVRDWLFGMAHFPNETALHLEHLILSHHGEHSYGAPILPQTAEAMALHQADLFSGKVSQVITSSQHARERGQKWSEYDRLLQRFLWVPEDGREG